MYSVQNDTSRKTADMLFRNRACSVDVTNPYVYVDGSRGPLYIDCSKLQKNPEDLTLVNNYLAGTILNTNRNVNNSKITGGETRDLVFSISVAERLSRSHVIIRKAEKKYGKQDRFVGDDLNAGDYVIHVADIVRSGSSAVRWIEAIRGAGAVIDFYYTVVDGNAGGEEFLEKLGVKLYSLTAVDEEFFNIGIEAGSISPSYIESLKRYLEDPKKWSDDYTKGLTKL